MGTLHVRGAAVSHFRQTHTPPKKPSPVFKVMATTGQIEEALAALALQEGPNYKGTAKEFGVCRTTLS